MQYIKYLVSGDSSIIVEFGAEINPNISEKIRAFKIAIEQADIKGIIETIPTYRSIMIQYKPEIISYNELLKKLHDITNHLSEITIPLPQVIEIPVLYGGEFGPDLNFVAQYNNITTEEVIKIHTSTEYLIYMLGFIAGFPYLGGMDDRIATPRLSSPRLQIEGGSVGIAGKQTGIYPIASPGGWQLIGRTPMKLYDADREKPILLEAGQYIKFKAINLDQYNEIENQVNNYTYKYNIYDKEV